MQELEYSEELGISKAEFAVWRNSKITKYVIERLKEERNQILEEVMDGNYLDTKDHARMFAKIGQAAGLRRLIDVEYGDDVDEEDQRD